MAIDPNRLVGVKTAYREKIDLLSVPTPACSKIALAVPPAGYTDRDGVAQTQVAEYEGQVTMVETSDRFLYNMYVVVDTGSCLEWKRCSVYTYAADPRTGQPYDPLASFYNNLAN